MFAVCKELETDCRKAVRVSDLKIVKKNSGRNIVALENYDPKNVDDFKAKTGYGRIKEDADGTKFIYMYWILRLYVSEKDIPKSPQNLPKLPAHRHTQGEKVPYADYLKQVERLTAAKLKKTTKDGLSHCASAMGRELVEEYLAASSEPGPKSEPSAVVPSSSADSAKSANLEKAADSNTLSSLSVPPHSDLSPPPSGLLHEAIYPKGGSSNSSQNALKLPVSTLPLVSSRASLSSPTSWPVDDDSPLTVGTARQIFKEVLKEGLDIMMAELKDIVKAELNGLGKIQNSSSSTSRGTCISISDATICLDDSPPPSQGQSSDDDKVYLGFGKRIKKVKIENIVKGNGVTKKTLRAKVQEILLKALTLDEVNKFWFQVPLEKKDFGQVFPDKGVTGITNVINITSEALLNKELDAKECKIRASKLPEDQIEAKVKVLRMQEAEKTSESEIRKELRGIFDYLRKKKKEMEEKEKEEKEKKENNLKGQGTHENPASESSKRKHSDQDNGMGDGKDGEESPAPKSPKLNDVPARTSSNL